MVIKKSSGFLSVFLAIAAAILLMVAGAVAFWLYQEKLTSKTGPIPTLSPTENLTTASPPLPTLTPTPMPTPKAQQPTDLELIKQAFAAKYGKPIEDVEVNINQNTGTHAAGSVHFAGEMGGGMWLAAKEGESWLLVYDGHGTIPCSAIEPYNFPTDMVPECWDEATSKIIYR